MHVLRLTLFLLCLGFQVFGVEGSKNNLTTYFELLDSYPVALGPKGNWQDGEIEIVRDIEGVEKAKKATGRQVGVVAQDKYWLWVNDAVRFPGGNYGVYGRFLWNQSLHGTTGVAVMALLDDNRIVLNCNYRHATRCWELELPRGASMNGEIPLDTARREVKEETGMVIDQLIKLGEMATDTGVTNAVVPIFYARVIRQEQANPEESEAIEGIIAFSVAEVLKGISQGDMSVPINGKTRLVKLRDPFLTFAILQAQLKGLIKVAL